MRYITVEIRTSSEADDYDIVVHKLSECLTELDAEHRLDWFDIQTDE